MEQRETEVKPSGPSVIRVYAVEAEWTQTHTDHVTRQGFGYSSPLETPIRRKSRHYIWEGRLHPNKAESPKAREEYISSSGGGQTAEEAAQHFSVSYRERRNPDLERRGMASYSFIFKPTEDIVTEEKNRYPSDAAVVVRGLNVEEREKFLAAFQEANKVRPA